jgi:tetratricopeptide (TPR) repeat protein
MGRTSTAAALMGLALLMGGCRTLPAVWSLDADGESASASLEEASPELHFLVGRELELDGDLDAALAAYQEALALDPDSPELLRKVAEISARRNRLDDAAGYAERALAIDPEDRGTRLFLGTLYRFLHDIDRAGEVLLDEDGQPLGGDAALLYYGALSDAGRFDDAARVAEWLIEHEPDTLRGYFALADAIEKQGDAEAAEAVLRKGLEANPDELALFGALARSRRDRGDREGEIAVYREILVIEPQHHVTLLALAEALLREGRLDEAVEVLEDLEREYPNDMRSVLRLGFVHFERRDWPQARERFERALEVNPEQHEVRYFLGVVERRMADDDAAIQTFLEIPPGHERFPEARTQVAAIYEKRGDYQQALDEVERARRQGEARPLDLYAASLRSKTGDFAGALGFLESLLAEAPDDPELLYNLGVLHGEAQEVDEALAYMHRALEKQPDHAGALNYIGYTWAESGSNLDEAEEYINRALQIRPDDGYITDSLGWIYYMRARPLLESGRHADARVYLERALRELERATELTGGDPVISEHLGDVYLLMEESERALEMYEEALRLEPRSVEQPDLQEKVDRLRRDLGQQ